MLRIPWSRSDGRPGWALVTQPEHARLAALAAAALSPERLQLGIYRDEFLQALAHHDDGWSDWERRPEVDPTSGKPRAFDEMPLAASLAIWRKSIACAAALGPLAAFCVSGHFSALLRRFNSSWQQIPARAALAQEFLSEQTRQQDIWLAPWQAQDSGQPHTVAVAQRALAWLQWFDALSLALCLHRGPDPIWWNWPDGTAVQLTPLARTTARPVAEPSSSPPRVIERAFALSPWAIIGAELKLSAAARWVPEASYQSAEQLAAAPAESLMLSLTLQPGAV